MRRNNSHFFLLAPNFFGFKGGVQVYSEFLLKSLQQLHPDANYDVFLKYENSIKNTDHKSEFLSQTRFYPFGEKVCDPNPWRRRLRTTLSSSVISAKALIHRPQLIISTELNYYAILCQSLKKMLGIPYWIVLHGIEAWDLSSEAYKSALRDADHVIAVSHYTRDRILSEGYLEPGKVLVLANAFDASRFVVKPKPTYLLDRYGLNADHQIILTVTRLQGFAHYKGYDKILRMLPKIRQHAPKVHYILVGKGDDRPRIEKMITELGVQDCVTLAGFVPDEELPDYYSLCDVFAMPSKGEGFGIVYLEALAAGKPVIAGNKDGAVDPLLNGKLGCLVDPDNEEEIAAHLIDILQGSYANKNLYDPAWLRQEVCSHFEIARFNTTLEQFLNSFIFNHQIPA